jgi:hypothetical protein
MAKQQPIRHGDQPQHISRGDQLDRPVTERNIPYPRPASEAEKREQERQGRARKAVRDRGKVGDPARAEDERSS